MLLFSEAADRTSGKVLSLRVSDAEDLYLQKECTDRGINMTTLLRMCILKTLKPNTSKPENDSVSKP